MVKSLLKLFPSYVLDSLITVPLIRKNLIFKLKHSYFDQLNFKVSIGRGLSCPIANPSANYSFEEIFFENEYQAAFEELPLPEKWLDLGCHFGYFSLYLAWLHAGSSHKSNTFKGFLLDADSRVGHGVAELIRINSLEHNLTFVHGAISESCGLVSFMENSVMSSSLSVCDVASAGTSIDVPVIDQFSIMKILAPPYDLVKIDVEGAEYDFLLSYNEIIASANALIIEWHSWHRGGGSELEIQKMVQSYGFELRKVLQQTKSCGPSPQDEVGVLLFCRRSADL